MVEGAPEPLQERWLFTSRKSGQGTCKPMTARQLSRLFHEAADAAAIRKDVTLHALRHAAPWSRKISATSSAGRDTAADRYAGGWSLLLLLEFLRGCDSRSSGLSIAAIMPVATRV